MKGCQTWGKVAAVAAQGGAAVRIIDVASDPDGPPRGWALALGPNTLGGGIPAALYAVRVGVGSETFEWRGLPAPPAGAVYVVHGHTVQVDLLSSAAAGISATGWASPSDLPPTLTP